MPKAKQTLTTIKRAPAVRSVTTGDDKLIAAAAQYRPAQSEWRVLDPGIKSKHCLGMFDQCRRDSMACCSFEKVMEYDTSARASAGKKGSIKFVPITDLPHIARRPVPSKLTLEVCGQAVIIRMFGDSMEPKYPSGCYVLVDTYVDKHSLPDGDYVICDGISHYVTRCQQLPVGTLIRISTYNPHYTSLDVPLDRLWLCGRAIAVLDPKTWEGRSAKPAKSKKISEELHA